MMIAPGSTVRVTPSITYTNPSMVYLTPAFRVLLAVISPFSTLLSGVGSTVVLSLQDVKDVAANSEPATVASNKPFFIIA
ncbi:hypothetical protein D3C87_1919760 [compost metagenome]